MKARLESLKVRSPLDGNDMLGSTKLNGPRWVLTIDFDLRAIECILLESTEPGAKVKWRGETPLENAVHWVRAEWPRKPEVKP